MKVAIKNGELPLFQKLLKNGVAIEDRANTSTRRLVRELRAADIPVIRAYDSRLERVVLALERPIKARRQRRTLNQHIFDILC